MSDFVVTEVPTTPAAKTGDERFEELGRAAYEAHVSSLRKAGLIEGNSAAPWEGIGSVWQQAWIESAKAIASRLALRQ